MQSKKYTVSLCFMMLVISLNSCNKFVEIPTPPNQLSINTVFSDDKTATAVITGIYTDMEVSSAFASSLTILPGMSADELLYTSSDMGYTQFANNSIAINNPNNDAVWRIYKYIYQANSAIEGITGSTQVTPATKNQLLGEAKFVRALCNFYLVNFYGKIPLVLSTDYRINAVLSRTATDSVNNQIIADLKDAQSLMSADYVSSERVRPNYWTATALLARVCLYTGDWKEAETQASAIISSGLYTLSDISSVFVKESNETIWQLMPVSPGFNTQEAASFIPGAPDQIPVFPLTEDLVNDFESGDMRKDFWTGNTTVDGTTYYYPFKYQINGPEPLNEYHIVFRLAEQFLIRAEALAMQNDGDGSVSDLNIIRERAGLPDLSSPLDATQLAAAIEQERRIELFAEWGHRWMDLKRTNRADAVLSILKGASWQSTDILWPVPQTQRNADPFLSQNPGY
jgi:hypothetical protein